jgi:hypothetical protein
LLSPVRAPLLTLAAPLALLLTAAASAQTTGERGAAILIFPKVVADGSADTLLQVANLSPSRVGARCSYVDGDRGWQASSFSLSLVAEQPLYWSAARGRAATGGEDPNDVPAAPADFRGELLCVELDGTGAPTDGNRLVGRATVTALADGDAFAYAAVGLRGLGLNDGNETLCIGGDFSDSCLFGAEYDACPAAWMLGHPSSGAPDSQLGAAATQDTRLVIVPCSQNVRDGEPGNVAVSLQVTNEFEQSFSARTDVTCWADRSLAEISSIFTVDLLGSPTAQTRLRPTATSGGFVVLAELERRAAAGGPVVGRAALIPHQEGAGVAADLIVLPMGLP